MKKKTKDGFPQISILMAVYEPRMDWLKEQLDSLEAQTYPNIRLYIRDDCSPTVPHEDICVCVADSIHSFPYTIRRNEQNLGSNKTFERLTAEADGDCFAYCDQDDIWLPEKLEVLQEEMEESGSLLVCSDMYIIDGAGKKTADSITKVRRHHVFRSGTGLTDTLWYSNFASGCALLVRAGTAKAALPLNPCMYYDHYITLYSANLGRVTSLEQPLLYHREHGGNQSGTFQNVTNRETYLRNNVDAAASAVTWLTEEFPAAPELEATLRSARAWLEARQAYLRGDRKRAGDIWKYRRFSPRASLFELAMPYIPAFLFRLALWARKARDL